MATRLNIFFLFFFTNFCCLSSFFLSLDGQLLDASAVEAVIVDPYKLIPGNDGTQLHFVEPISEEYLSGRNLIYDCDGRFFACVHETSQKLCDEKKRKSYLEKKQIYSCVTLKKFPNIEECLKKQKSLMGAKIRKTFCRIFRT